jgi:hypothetical protein
LPRGSRMQPPSCPRGGGSRCRRRALAGGENTRTDVRVDRQPRVVVLDSSVTGRGSRESSIARANMIAGPISSLRFTQTGDFVLPSTLLLRLRGVTVCRNSRSVVTTPKPILNPLHCIRRRPPRKMYPHERTNPSESWRWRTMVRKRSSTQIRQDTSGNKTPRLRSTPWPIIRRRALRPKRSSARR